MTQTKLPAWWPACPYPADIFPLALERYAEIVPDPEQRTALSGALGRHFWQIAAAEIWHCYQLALQDRNAEQTASDARDADAVLWTPVQFDARRRVEQLQAEIGLKEQELLATVAGDGNEYMVVMSLDGHAQLVMTKRNVRPPKWLATIDTGDTVYHRPTGETWIVAGVDGAYLWPVGWPPGRANLTDCVPLGKASPEQKARLQADLAKAPADDERRQFGVPAP